MKLNREAKYEDVKLRNFKEKRIFVIIYEKCLKHELTLPYITHELIQDKNIKTKKNIACS